MRPDFAFLGTYRWDIDPTTKVFIRRRPDKNGVRARGIFDVVVLRYTGPTSAGLPTAGGPWVGQALVYKHGQSAISVFRRWRTGEPSAEPALAITVSMLPDETDPWPSYAVIGSEEEELDHDK